MTEAFGGCAGVTDYGVVRSTSTQTGTASAEVPKRVKVGTPTDSIRFDAARRDGPLQLSRGRKPLGHASEGGAGRRSASKAEDRQGKSIRVSRRCGGNVRRTYGPRLRLSRTGGLAPPAKLSRPVGPKSPHAARNAKAVGGGSQLSRPVGPKSPYDFNPPGIYDKVNGTGSIAPECQIVFKEAAR